MLKQICATLITTSVLSATYAQDTTVVVVPKLTVTGSVDAYYRFNSADNKDLKNAGLGDAVYNSPTSFTKSHNSFELGMASVKFDYNTGKVGVVADLGFGRRAEEFSYNDEGTLAAVKQAYVTYAPSNKIKFTFGKFGTHVGYELLDPQLNRNYSMSYMFSYGPFFHTGLKADIAISDNFGFMVGVANPTDYSTASFEKKSIIAQLHGTAAEGKLSAYLNYVGGEDLSGANGNQVDAVITGKVSDKFSIGYNGTVKFVKTNDDNSDSWWASALY
ncbi:MAG: porin, partial [Chitinophagaceae bacterium]|nr:porin [Chitinophagaceae bacterium]